MAENSSSNSSAPNNNNFFSDGNILRDLGKDLGKLEGRLDGHDREIDECKGNIKDLRDAVSKLKEWRAFIIGGAAAIAALVSWLTSLFLK